MLIAKPCLYSSDPALTLTLLNPSLKSEDAFDSRLQALATLDTKSKYCKLALMMARWKKFPVSDSFDGTYSIPDSAIDIQPGMFAEIAVLVNCDELGGESEVRGFDFPRAGWKLRAQIEEGIRSQDDSAEQFFVAGRMDFLDLFSNGKEYIDGFGDCTTLDPLDQFELITGGFCLCGLRHPWELAAQA